MSLLAQWSPGMAYMCVLPVGAGNAVFVLSPSGLVLLFDCGGNGDFSTSKFLGLMKNTHGQGIQRAVLSGGRSYDIAKLVVSHPHVDHIRDIHAYYGPNRRYHVAHLRRFKESVDRAGLASHNGSPDWRPQDVECVRALKRMSDEYRHPCESLDYGEGFAVHEFQNDETWLVPEFGTNDQQFHNNASVVAVIEWGFHKWLIPGDMEIAGWARLLERGGFSERAKGCSIAIASHHGHRSGWNPAVVAQIGKPAAWIISAKRGDLHIADAYSSGEFATGYPSQDGRTRYSFSTRNGAAIEVLAHSKSGYCIEETRYDQCLRNANQQRIAARRLKQILRASGGLH